MTRKNISNEEKQELTEFKKWIKGRKKSDKGIFREEDKSQLKIISIL